MPIFDSPCRYCPLVLHCQSLFYGTEANQKYSSGRTECRPLLSVKEEGVVSGLPLRDSAIKRNHSEGRRVPHWGRGRERPQIHDRGREFTLTTYSIVAEN